MQWKQKAVQMIPSLATGLAILWLTLAPDPIPGPPHLYFQGQDKAVHAAMFFVWTLLICRDIRATRHRPRPWLAALFTTLTGGLIELLQEAMDMGRSAEWLDFGADAAGAFLAAIVFILLTKHPTPNSSPPL